ncbi:9523_t:CDS:2 [Racocetra fulgida]|uniref:9523_t:CDS:1 n=1 Tax=Racocetra fulgida TaxID=60492 RepID=A0A9N8ZBV2_9GLOM|nr:9523_t:CDS:2 [Racocetra fulgida]
MQYRKSLNDFPNMPTSTITIDLDNSLIAEELTYDQQSLTDFVNYTSFLDSQDS